MKNKKIILAVIALVAVAAIFLGVYFATRPATAGGSKAITVTVVHADGSSKDFTYRTDAEYLGELLAAEGLIQGDETQYGLTVHTVDGEKASWEENQSYWALYIGEEYAMTGVSQTPVTDGAVYKWVYTIG